MSIQRRLVLGLVTGLTALYAVACLTTFLCVRMVLQRHLEDALAAKARSFGTLVQWMPDGRLSLEPTDTLQTWNGTAVVEFYQAWAEDGTVLLRSPSLGQTDLSRGPNSDAPSFADGTLPGGIPARVVTFRLTPRQEDEDEKSRESPVTATSAKSVVVSVAQDKSEHNRFLWTLLWADVSIAALACLGTMVVVQIVVRRGLQPLQRLAARAAKIDEQTLHIRFPVDRLPAELQPICLRLNDSLQRLQEAFTRERRFTADVAHELRTPIAELRVLADVALRGDADAASGAYFQDARDIAVQMERIVNTLLALARCHAGTMQAVSEPVDLEGVFRESWQMNEPTATARGVTASFKIPANSVIRSDRTMLWAILGNLLGNAAEYARPGGAVACMAKIDGETLKILVANPVKDLTAADVAHFFEPFWRKDAARSDGSHSGLGLALVRAYAENLGGTATATLGEAESLCMAVDLPIAAE